MEDNFENLDSQNEEEVVKPEIDETELGLPADPIEVEPKDEDADDAELLKQRNQELYEQNRKAKGLERDPKTGKWVKKYEIKKIPIGKNIVIPKDDEPMDDLTRKEQYSLFKANVPEEDMEECFIYARSHKMSITEALKLPEVKALLKVRQEYRKTTEAANISPSRRGSVKLDDETFVQNVMKGNLPTSDEDIARLARINANKRSN